MFLSRLMISRLPILSGLAVAVAALLLAAGPASAQQPGYGPPPGASKLWPWNVQGASQVVAAPRPAAPVIPPAAYRTPVFLPPRWDGSLMVTVTGTAPAPATATAAAPPTVNLRGPDGVVRSFPLEGGPEAIQRREVIVRPGESASIQVTGTARRR
jgi:hypothetical protein